jgi:hypothetical protein
MIRRQGILAQCILSSAYCLTHSWGRLVCARAFPHAGAPAHSTSRAPICSEISNRFSLELQGVHGLCEPPRRSTDVDEGGGYVLEREDLRTSASPYDDWSIQQQELKARWV